MNVVLKWNEKMQFEGVTEGVNEVVKMDALDPAFGGEKNGTTPKHIFLQSIAGCSAMDIVTILKKMKADLPDSFEVAVNGDLTEDHPKVFTNISLNYIIKGKTDPKKLIRAVKMSQETYCGLSIMIKKIVEFSYKVTLNEELIHDGK